MAPTIAAKIIIIVKASRVEILLRKMDSDE